jgi:nucleotide-binding universal stress UspA family protein
MSRNLYIVPHDLTEVGQSAFEYALFLGAHIKAEILVVHFVESASKIPAFAGKLQDLVQKTTISSSVTVSQKVCVGSVFANLSELVKAEHAQLIIMGTHGAKGLQKITGSHAMKVITSCEIPFIVVQKDTKKVEIKNIVVPIDLSKESLQIINNAGDLARIFDATVHVIGEKQNDEGLSQQIKNRVLLIRNKYDEKGAKCEIHLLESGGSYSKKIIQYVTNNAINVIALAYHSESLLPQFDTFAQSLITNEAQLPCMIVASKPAGNLYF